MLNMSGRGKGGKGLGKGLRMAPSLIARCQGICPKFGVFRLIFLQQLKLATSNSVHRV